MTIGRFSSPRNTPFYWWGGAERRLPAPELAELIDAGMLLQSQAALLLDLISLGLSTFVISERSGAGKSTLLAALLDALPPAKQRLYLRGNYETFDFRTSRDPAECLLLVNELSPHLPVYLWGAPVTTLFQAMQEGFQVVGTAHAGSAPAFLHQLNSAPLRVPVELTSRHLIVVILPAAAGRRFPGDLDIVGMRPGAVASTTLVESIISSNQPAQIDFEAVRRMVSTAALQATDLVSEAPVTDPPQHKSSPG